MERVVNLASLESLEFDTSIPEGVTSLMQSKGEERELVKCKVPMTGVIRMSSSLLRGDWEMLGLDSLREYGITPYICHQWIEDRIISSIHSVLDTSEVYAQGLAPTLFDGDISKIGRDSSFGVLQNSLARFHPVNCPTRPLVGDAAQIAAEGFARGPSSALSSFTNAVASILLRIPSDGGNSSHGGQPTQEDVERTEHQGRKKLRTLLSKTMHIKSAAIVISLNYDDPHRAMNGIQKYIMQRGQDSEEFADGVIPFFTLSLDTEQMMMVTPLLDGRPYILYFTRMSLLKCLQTASPPSRAYYDGTSIFADESAIQAWSKRAFYYEGRDVNDSDFEFYTKFGYDILSSPSTGPTPPEKVSKNSPEMLSITAGPAFLPVMVHQTYRSVVEYLNHGQGLKDSCKPSADGTYPTSQLIYPGYWPRDFQWKNGVRTAISRSEAHEAWIQSLPMFLAGRIDRPLATALLHPSVESSTQPNEKEDGGEDVELLTRLRGPSLSSVFGDGGVGK